jgi:hypothetical protein
MNLTLTGWERPQSAAAGSTHRLTAGPVGSARNISMDPIIPLAGGRPRAGACLKLGMHLNKGVSKLTLVASGRVRFCALAGCVPAGKVGGFV